MASNADDAGKILIESASNGDVSGVVRALSESGGKADVNFQIQNSESALLAASAAGHTEVVEVLLQQSGIDVNLRNRNLQTPLRVAVYADRDEVVALLLKRPDIDVNIPDSYHHTALHFANVASTKLLLARADVQVNVQNQDGCSPLYYVFVRGREKEIARLLLRRPDLDVNICDNEARTTLHRVAHKQQTSNVWCILHWQRLKNPRKGGRRPRLEPMGRKWKHQDDVQPQPAVVEEDITEPPAPQAQDTATRTPVGIAEAEQITADEQTPATPLQQDECVNARLGNLEQKMDKMMDMMTTMMQIVRGEVEEVRKDVNATRVDLHCLQNEIGSVQTCLEIVHYELMTSSRARSEDSGYHRSEGHYGGRSNQYWPDHSNYNNYNSNYNYREYRDYNNYNKSNYYSSNNRSASANRANANNATPTAATTPEEIASTESVASAASAAPAATEDRSAPPPVTQAASKLRWNT